MFSTLIGKQKIAEEKLAKQLVHGTLKVVDEVWADIRDYLLECPHFETDPLITEDDDMPLIITLFTCNLGRIPSQLDNGQDKRMAQLIIKELAWHLNKDVKELGLEIAQCKSTMKRLNHPSKNLIYAMPKALFHSYNLNQYQQEYFKGLNSPIPLYLKEMNELLSFLVWDWDSLKEEYRIIEG